MSRIVRQNNQKLNIVRDFDESGLLLKEVGKEDKQYYRKYFKYKDGNIINYRVKTNIFDDERHNFSFIYDKEGKLTRVKKHTSIFFMFKYDNKKRLKRVLNEEYIVSMRHDRDDKLLRIEYYYKNNYKPYIEIILYYVEDQLESADILKNSLLISKHQFDDKKRVIRRYDFDVEEKREMTTEMAYDDNDKILFEETKDNDENIIERLEYNYVSDNHVIKTLKNRDETVEISDINIEYY